MGPDILSEVLRSVRLRGALFFFVNGARGWAAEAPAASEIAGLAMPGVEHVMEYHMVTEGQCWAAIVGENPVRLNTGDVVLFPHGDPHVLSSAPGMRAPVAAKEYFGHAGKPPFTVHLDGAMQPREDDRGETTIVCGFLGCDLRPFNPLIASLPRVLHLAARDEQAWGALFMRQAVIESHGDRPGSQAVLERMSEMMFVDAMRQYVESLPAESGGWLAGLRDRFVGRALTLIHEDPAHDWSVEALGQRVGLSRSALHERFAQMIGLAPMQYLANWRMQVAAALLRDTSATVASIAQEVGYDSEAAFARAFKRVLGRPPAAWRRERLAPRRHAIPA
jgi:AraC-like DNA-binding protein